MHQPVTEGAVRREDGTTARVIARHYPTGAPKCAQCRATLDRSAAMEPPLTGWHEGGEVRFQFCVNCRPPHPAIASPRLWFFFERIVFPAIGGPRNGKMPTVACTERAALAAGALALGEEVGDAGFSQLLAPISACYSLDDMLHSPHVPSTLRLWASDNCHSPGDRFDYPLKRRGIRFRVTIVPMATGGRES